MGHRFLFASDEAGAETITLVPERDVIGLDGKRIATSREPWLRLEFAGGVPANRWIELIYEASLVDPLARPLLRCLTAHDVKEEILPGPLFGRAVWLGKIPAKTHAIWISPTDRPGPFAFRIVGLREISFSERLARGWRPRHTLLALGLGLSANHVWPSAISAARSCRRRSNAMGRWREARRRYPDWSGLDALPAERRRPAYPRGSAGGRRRGRSRVGSAGCGRSPGRAGRWRRTSTRRRPRRRASSRWRLARRFATASPISSRATLSSWRGPRTNGRPRLLRSRGSRRCAMIPIFFTPMRRAPAKARCRG